MPFKPGCSNYFGFRDMAYFIIFSSLFSINLYSKINKKWENLNFIVRYYQSTIRSCNSGLQLLLLSFAWFSRYDFIIFIEFFRNFALKQNNKIATPWLYVVVVESRVADLASNCFCSNAWFLMIWSIFFKKFH